MKNYMGHFGEIESPESILSRVSDIEVLMSENNLVLQGFNKDKARLESEISQLSSLVTTNTARIAFLEKKARDSYSSFLKNMSTINIFG